MKKIVAIARNTRGVADKWLMAGSKWVFPINWVAAEILQDGNGFVGRITDVDGDTVIHVSANTPSEVQRKLRDAIRSLIGDLTDGLVEELSL